MKELDAKYIVFQGNPRQESINYWIDGEKVKRTMKIKDFLDIIKSKCPEIMKEVYDASNTYSFSLISFPDHTITHLMPKLENNPPYPDSINNLIFGKKEKHLITEKQSVIDVLNSYGFNLPSAQSIQNLQVTLEKKEEGEEGFLARFFNRNRITQKLPKDITK